jgi:predicted SAM-dependent methyltransferase
MFPIGLLRRACEKAALIRKQRESAARRREAAAVVEQLPRPIKLHLGCGTNYLPGWFNVDANARLERLDLAWNINLGLPLPDACCELVYSEHVLEHFPVERGVELLRECRRVLRPGGTLRIAMPSLAHVLAKYTSDDWRDQDWLTWPEFQFIETRAEMVNVSLRWWGHEWLYDHEELHRRLREAGFTEIEDLAWGESTLEGLRGLETRRDSLLVCEARKME